MNSGFYILRDPNRRHVVVSRWKLIHAPTDLPIPRRQFRLKSLKSSNGVPMPRYVDGYVIPIKKKNVKKYAKLATWGKRVWMKCGALSYYETYMDELAMYGQGFKKMCKLKSDETAVFAFVVYKSKAHRNSVNKKVAIEMAKADANKMKMPFDMKRFAAAGCKVIVRAN
jgi:uncharacterized protein YbaA (DUF1428 family)